MKKESSKQGAQQSIDASFYKTLLENVSDGVYFVSPERQILYWNKTAESISGFPPQEAVGHYCYDNFLNHVSESGVNLCLNGCPLHATLADGKPRRANVYLHHKNGHRVPVTVRTSAVRDKSGKIIGAVETFYENTEQEEMKQKLRELECAAYQDPLTGIANRRHVEQALEISFFSFKTAQRDFGFALIDVDRFKEVNDAYGHDVGDQALQMVANTLKHNLRSSDVVGRWGGDEFVVIISDTNFETLRATVKKLRVLVAESRLRIKGLEVGVTVSIGATLVRPDDTLESLYRRADALLYKSKEENRNRVNVG